ncbi:hypothetical protein D3C75_600340 [compost metagenome]
MVDVHAFGAGEDERGTAFGLQAQGFGAGQFADLVGPGAGGVDDDWRAERLAVGLNVPYTLAVAAQADDFAVGMHFALVAADTAQIALVQGIGVNVAGGRVVDGAVDLFPAQDRHQRAGLVGAEQLHLRHRGFCALVLPVQFVRVAGQVHGHFAPRGQQRVFAETAGRVVEKVPAGQGQRPYLRGAVGRGVQRRRTAGGVIGRMGFAFEHDHAAVLRQPETCGSTGNSAADDDEICLAHERLLMGRKCQNCGCYLWEPDSVARGLAPVRLRSSRNSRAWGFTE